MVRLHLAAFKIDEVKAGLGRVQSEIGDADDVVLPDRIARAHQFALGDIEEDAVARGAGGYRRENARW